MPTWFERLTGFPEADYAATRARLAVEGRELVSRVDGRRHGIGALELPSLAELRGRAADAGCTGGGTRLRVVVGDVRAMHRDPVHAGATFQVASQFNLLEMTGPEVTPEHGVTRYASDPTQGPACAIAAGAATVYRNYFAPVGDGVGQTRDRQLDALADLGAALSAALGRPVASLWSMRNGYALCTRDGLAAIDAHLASLDEPGLDALRARLRIGAHRDVEVTDVGPEDAAQARAVHAGLAHAGPAGVAHAGLARTDPRGAVRPVVSQAFCSALPVAYSGLPQGAWARFARLVLEAAYEATLLEAALNAHRGASRTVLLTRLGGGAFGNDDAWIDAAIVRAMACAGGGLDVAIVSYGPPPASLRAFARRFGGA